MPNPTSNQIQNKSSVTGTTVTAALETLKLGMGASDHGTLTGLADDDHPQYHNDARGDARYAPVGHTHSNATSSTAGFMSAADKTKIDTVASGATANDTDANLKNRANHTGTQPVNTLDQSGATTGQVLSWDGSAWVPTTGAGGGGVTDHGLLTGLADDDHIQYHTDARGDARYSQLGHTHSNATTSVAGFMSAADKTKLDGVAPGATANTGTVTGVTGTAPIVSSGGTTPAISITAATTSAAGSMSAADKTKLNGIATGATANSSDATLLNRANHTGTQALSTLSQSSATTNQVPSWNGSEWVPTTFSGGGSTIKAIQRGTITIATSTSSATATITSVDTAKTEVRFLGGSGVSTGGSAHVPRIVLTNSTTITASVVTNSSGSTVLSWELTEYN